MLLIIFIGGKVLAAAIQSKQLRHLVIQLAHSQFHLCVGETLLLASEHDTGPAKMLVETCEGCLVDVISA